MTSQSEPRRANTSNRAKASEKHEPNVLFASLCSVPVVLLHALSLCVFSSCCCGAVCRSVLEHMHLSATFKILLQPENNFLVNLKPAQFESLRRTVIEMVLATDLGVHFDFIGHFKNALPRLMTSSDRSTEAGKLMLLKMCLKCSDIAHAAKVLDLHIKWSARIVRAHSAHTHAQSAESRCAPAAIPLAHLDWNCARCICAFPSAKSFSVKATRRRLAAWPSPPSWIVLSPTSRRLSLASSTSWLCPCSHCGSSISTCLTNVFHASHNSKSIENTGNNRRETTSFSSSPLPTRLSFRFRIALTSGPLSGSRASSSVSVSTFFSNGSPDTHGQVLLISTIATTSY